MVKLTCVLWPMLVYAGDYDGAQASIQSISSDAAKASSDLTKAYQDAQQSQFGETQKVIKDMEDRMGAVEKDANEQMNELSSWESQTGKELTDMNTDIVQKASEMSLFKSETEGEAEELEEYMNDGLDETVSQMDANTEAAIAKGEYEVQDALESTAEIADGVAEGYGVVDEEMSEAAKELSETVNSNNQENQATGKELTEEQKGISSEIKADLKALSGAEKVFDKNAGKLEKRTDEGVKNVEETKTDADRDAEKAANGAMKEIDGELNDMRKSVKNEVKEMSQTFDSKTKELEAETSEVVNSANQAQQEAQQEAHANQAEAEKEINKDTDELSQSEDNLNDLAEDAQSQAEAQNEALTKEEGKLQNDIRSANGEVEEAKTSMVNRVSSQMENMKTTTLKALSAEEDKVKQQAERTVDGVESEIKKGQTEVEDATDALGSATEELEQNVKLNQGLVKKELAGLDGTKSQIERTQKEVEQQINGTREATMEEIQESKDYVTSEVQQADHMVEDMAQDSQAKSTAELQKTSEEIARRIQDYVSKGEMTLKGAERAMTMAQRNAEDNVASMSQVASDISTKKAEVERLVNPTAEIIQAAQGAIDKEIGGVDQEIKSTKEKVMQEIMQKAGETSDRFSQQLGGVEASVRSETQENEEATGRTLTQLLDEINELRGTSDSDFSASDKMVQQMRALLKEAQDRAKGIADESGQQKSELERAIEATINKMTETDRTESRSTHDMQATLEGEMHAAMQSAATKTSDTIKQVMTDESGKLKVFVQNAQQDIEKDEMAARDYAQQAQDKLSKVSTDVDNLGVMLQKNEIAAQTKSSDLLAEAAQLMRQQKELAAAAARATDEEREHIQKQAKELNAKLLAKVAQIEANEHQSLSALKTEVGNYYHEESDRLSMDKEKIDASVTNHEHRIQAQMSRMDDAVEKTHGYSTAFEHEENSAESSFQKAISDLGKDMQISEDRIGEAVRKEDQDVANTMTDEIGKMEGLVGDLKGVQRGANQQIGDMKANFKDELAYFANAGRQRSQELAQKLDHVEGSAVDLVSEFNQDTEASRSELAATQGRLGKVVNSTMAQMETFKQRLAEIRSSREREAVALHDEISGVKGELTGTMGQTVDVIEEMKAETDAAYKKMEKEQTEFERMLVSASQLSSSHDSGEIQAMTAKMYDLEAMHKRLMQWQRTFRHYTAAYRSEADRKLGILSNGIGADEDQIAAGRLHSELAMQEGMRNLQRGVEGEVVDAVGKQSGAVGGLVNSIRNEMQEVFNDANHDEQAGAAEIQQTKNELNNADAQSTKEINEINEAQTQLLAKTNEFNNAVATAQDGISGDLKLQQHAATPANQELNAQLNALRTRVDGLEQTTSFLQEAQGRHQQDTQTLSEQEEVQALQALNQQLRKENAALASEDDKLEKRVVDIKGQLKAAGVKI